MDLEEENAIKEMMAMSNEELLLVPHTIVKWICQAKGCIRHTKAKDYGIAPVYFHPRLKGRWHDTTKYYYLCAKHYKLENRLAKRFGIRPTQNKILDYNKQNIILL